MGSKCGFQESGVVLHSFYVKLLLIKRLEKYDFQEPSVVLHRFNIQLLLINLISTLNYRVLLKI